ncbi:ribosome hibernation-promoting factor, HPF/YfiA family [Desulfoluna butyratoxydans]|uniref:Ribosome hibernation promoting factor n=1 Tax=Desulfoluna butyratoxydans TaxID=231438 RepID=A0A4U8YTG2_9BACT|nr:ribosome-associated translation inhibitor RaiA [Desulfoluna butyratoxydans]VFQ47270.1 ribosomal protein s30ae/sigma 54 modulation protein [Desulfoluna butyratoxydans]
MQVSVTFKNIDPSDALKAYATKKLERIDKLLDAPSEANVVFSVEKIRHITEINVTSGRTTVHATETSERMYAAIDLAVDKIKQQLSKNKKKIQARKSGNPGIRPTLAEEINEAPVDVDEFDDFSDFDMDEDRRLA